MEPTTNPFTLLADRLFASWRTTLLAVLLGVFLAVMYFTGRMEWVELRGYLSAFVVLMLTKDPAVVKKEKEQAVAQAVQDCAPTTGP